MSFREIRNFTEMMRALGFPRAISMESFRTPHFELVADCLFWLFQRYDPGTDITDDISTETERVNFLQAIAQAMLTKARLKLNIKRLYAADGMAVKELLKIATLLYKATFEVKGVDEEAEVVESQDLKAAVKAVDASVVRQLTSEVTQAGAAMFDALGMEPELRVLRSRALERNMDTESVERSVREAAAAVTNNIASVSRLLQELDDHSKNLETRIEKRGGELERVEKRVATLQAVRPAYMDEYEHLQAELQGLFGTYLERFRNLEYLEGQLRAHRALQQEAIDASERNLKKMQKRLRDEELRVLRGEAAVDEEGLDDSLAYDAPQLVTPSTGEGGGPPAAITRSPGNGFGGVMGGPGRISTSGAPAERLVVQRAGSAAGMGRPGPVAGRGAGAEVVGSLMGAGSSDSRSDSIDEDTGSGGSSTVSLGGDDAMEGEPFPSGSLGDSLSGSEELESEDNDF